MSKGDAKLLHERLGLCELLRVEGTDWIVEAAGGVRYRIPPDKRSQFQVIQESTQQPPKPVGPATPLPIANPGRHARRIIESLRIGLPSLDGHTRQLAVGFQETNRFIKGFLEDISEDGGGAMTLKGAYGQGKTFALTMLEEVAHEGGFITARTEIDATENCLNKPHHIYHDLMRNLRIPGFGGQGARLIAQKVVAHLQQHCPGTVYQRKQWLEAHIGCPPLAWLLSDPQLTAKPELIGLLGADPNYPIGRARGRHAMTPVPRTWPAFTAGTQGDFASFILSGIGRVARMLGYKGFVIIMDEMEKWHELNWAQQSQAGNLLGGLIWGATAEEGDRGMHDQPDCIDHSNRCGGYPFTTERRCHTGIAIAMTPREYDVSDQLWSKYGPILQADVPTLSEKKLLEYCGRVVPLFAEAFGVGEPKPDELKHIAAEALGIWRTHGELNTRYGVQAAIAAFDHWRDRH
jgi:hypothetical protein